MPYVKTAWENLPSNTTPISAGNLNKIEDALDFALNKSTASATLNADWESGYVIGLEFNKIGNLVIANFAASITNVTGMHLFIGNIPEGFRPTQVTPMPAVFVPTATTDYEARIMIIHPDGRIQIAKNPTVTGTFFCAMVYFVE